MKNRFRRFFAIVFIIAVVLSFSGINAFAATETQDNLEVTLVTDKDEYAENEQINTKLTVKNNNSFAINDVELLTDLPSGYGVADDTSNRKTVDSIEAGEAVTLETALKKGADADGGSSDSDRTIKLIVIIGIIVVIVILLIVIVILLVKRKKESVNRIVSLILCISLLGVSVLSLSGRYSAAETALAVSEDNDHKSIGVSAAVTVNAQPLEIKAVVQYSTVDMPFSAIITDFTADQGYFVCGDEETVTFTVKSDINKQNVELIRNDTEFVGIMHDDGLYGDIAANDGTYTYVTDATVRSASNTSVKYNARWNDEISNEQTLYYFAPLTAETAQAAQQSYQSLSTAITNTEKKYADGQGYVPDVQGENVVRDIKSTLNEYVSNGTVLLYRETEGNFDIKLSSGLTLAYSPRMMRDKETDALGADESAAIYTFQPCYTDMGGPGFSTSAYTLPQGVNYVLEMLDDVADDVDEAFSNYSFSSSRNYDDEDVTLNTIKSIGRNQVVLWHGHGYYGPLVKSCLVTGEDFDWGAWWFDVGYFGDCVANRIINSMLTGYDKVIISSSYIERYCSDMSNTFVYLAACDSGKTSELADAFLKKGCAAVVANSDTIQRSYNVAMLYETVRLMSTINPSTDNYYTLQEALTSAKRVYDASDRTARYGGLGATPNVFGGTDAENYRFRDVNGTLSGKVCKASDRVTAIPNASINIYKNNAIYRSLSSDFSGNYSVNLPEGEYYFEIKATGYIDFHSYATVVSSENTYVETFLMIDGSEDQKGVARGQIVNSLTNAAVDGVRLTIRKDWNNANANAETVATATTDSGGNYTVELPLGNYTVVLTKDGYLSSSFNIIVQSGTTDNQNSTITPVVSGDEFLITLTWGENPRDLDAHVEGTLSTGGSFHVYYDYMNEDDGSTRVCSLDYDDRYSYGPEHITLKTTTDKPYYFYVFRYAGDGTVAGSGAKVTIHMGNQLVRTYNVPTNLGSDDYWNVFAIKGGEIITRNTITSGAETSYAD